MGATGKPHISIEGRLALFLGLFALGGAGAALIWPDYKIIGLVLFSTAIIGLILLAIYHYSVSLRPILQRWRIYLAVAIILLPIVIGGIFWPRSNFSVEFYSLVVGKTDKAYLINPTILLLKIDNTGRKTSSLGEWGLTAEINGVPYQGRNHTITGTITLKTGDVLLPSNALYNKAVRAISPGDSVIGALMFTFPMLDQEYLLNMGCSPTRSKKEFDRANCKFFFHFSDIYGNKFSFPLMMTDFSDNRARFPGIDYH